MLVSRILVLLLFLPLPLMAEDADYESGFRGLAWGTPFESVSEQMQKSDNRIPPFRGFVQANENLQWEGVTVKEITYGFTKKKKTFGGLNISFDKNDVAQVVAAINSRYGEAQKTDILAVTNYEWHTEKLDISLLSALKDASISFRPK